MLKTLFVLFALFSSSSFLLFSGASPCTFFVGLSNQVTNQYLELVSIQDLQGSMQTDFINQYNSDEGFPYMSNSDPVDNCCVFVQEGFLTQQNVVNQEWLTFMNGVVACGFGSNPGNPIQFGYASQTNYFPTLNATFLDETQILDDSSLCGGPPGPSHFTYALFMDCSTPPPPPSQHNCCFYYNCDTKEGTELCLSPFDECPGVAGFDFVTNHTFSSCTECENNYWEKIERKDSIILDLFRIGSVGRIGNLIW